MSTRAQQPPKGRINVKFEVDTNGEKQEVALPFKALYLGDLSGDTPKAALKEREPVPIDLDNFDEVLHAFRPSVDLAVADHLSGDPASKLSIHIDFESLADFTPDRLVDKVEALRALKARRDALAAIRYPLDTDRGDLAKKLAELLGDESARRVIAAHYNPVPTTPTEPLGDPE